MSQCSPLPVSLLRLTAAYYYGVEEIFVVAEELLFLTKVLSFSSRC